MPIVLAVPPRVPDPPVLNTVTPLNGALSVAWTPGSDGGSAITGYVVSAVITADGSVASIGQAGGGDTSFTLPLANDIQYDVTVIAINGVGPSTASNSISATPNSGAQPPVPPPVIDIPYQPLPQPMFEAFPVDEFFHPDNWLLTSDQVDATL